MRKAISTIFLLYIIILFGCGKEELTTIIKEPIPSINCTFNHTEPATNPPDTTFETCPTTSPEIIYKNRYSYERPIFNPNNFNELAYLRLDTENISAGYELFTFNFCTGENQRVTDKAFYDLDWSIKDWISFTSYDQNIYKIKSNGDSLTQLTFGDTNCKAYWNKNGTQLLYLKSFSSDAGIKIISEGGEIIETINDFFPSYINWHNDVISYSCDDLHYCIGNYNLETQIEEVVDNDNTMESILAPFYLESTNRYLWDGLEIGLTNENTLEKTILAKTTATKYLTLSDISPDEKIIAIHRTNVKVIGACTHEHDTAIYLMDIDGTNERRLIIPD